MFIVALCPQAHSAHNYHNGNKTFQSVKQTFKLRILQVCERTGNRMGHMDEGMKQAAGLTLQCSLSTDLLDVKICLFVA